MTGIITQIGVQGLVKGDPAARQTQIGIQALVRDQTVVSPINARAQGVQTNESVSAGIAGDPHYRKVSLLIQADKGLRDLSKYNDTLSGDRGFVFIRTTPAKFVKAFESVSSSTFGISWNRNPERFDFERGSFTIEGWVRRPSTSGFNAIIGNWWSGAPSSWFIATSNNALIFRASRDGSDTNIFNLVGPDLPANVWTHICVERDQAGLVRMYINGELVASGLFPDRIVKVTTPLVLMGRNRSYTARSNYIGYVDDFRVTKGVARYASDTGFLLPTAPNPIGPVSYDDFLSDPFWDKTTCVLDPFDGVMVDYKRGAAITGLVANAGARRITGAGTVAHVDGQWNIGGRTEPFTFEVDVGWNSSAGNGISQIVCPQNWILSTSRELVAFRLWNGSAYEVVFQWSNSYSDWYFPRGLENTTITRDEMGVYRFYQQGIFRGSVVSSLTPDTPTADLNIDGNDQRFIGCLRMTWGAVRYRGEGFIDNTLLDLPPPRSGPVYVAPALPEAVFPCDLKFPDPKTDTPVWRSVVGSSPTRRSMHDTGVLYDGNKNDRWRWLTGTSSPRATRDYARVFIPVQYKDIIDSDEVFLEYSGLGGSPYNFAIGGALNAFAYDAYGQPLSFSASNASASNSFTKLEGVLRLPAGTRSVEIGFITLGNDFNARYTFVDVSARLVDSFADSRVYLSKPTRNIGSTIKPDLAQWTDARGSTVIDSGALGWVGTSLTTTGRVMDLRCVDDLPASYVTDIDNGAAALKFRTNASRLDTSDFGYTYVEFLNAADDLVGRRVYSSPTPRIVSYFEEVVIDTPIPVGARKVVMGIVGSMEYAEAANGTNRPEFLTNFHEAYCYRPPAGQMPVLPAIPMPEGDEHWDNVVCLLSTRNGVIENLGNVRYQKSAVPFGVSVAAIDSPFGDTAIASNLSLVSGNSFYVEVSLGDLELGGFGPKMTFEGWFYKTHPLTTAIPTTGIHNQFGGNAGLDGSTSSITMDGTTTTNVQTIVGQWYHIAYCRDETGRGVLFMNGERQNVSRGAFSTLWNSTFRIGQYNSSNVFAWCGYYDEIRITKDVERYTENFTPPGNRYPTKLPSGSLLLTGDTGRLLITGDTGGILTS